MNNTTQSSVDAVDGRLIGSVAALRRLTVTEVRQILHIGRSTLHMRMKSGQIEFQRDGSRVFFTADAIAAYQDRQKCRAKEVNPTTATNAV